jgi:hypothetical protein
MSTNDLVEFSRARLAHTNQRRLLREKYEAKMLLAHRGGMFCAGPELLNLLALYLGQEIVIQDLYGNPVRVDASELQSLVDQRWQEQMNAWLIELDSLSKQR